jgi:sec-independent protein translocase protein TatB
VFGISLTELTLILVVALVVLGPERLPTMLRTLGVWISKLRRMTTEVRAQTGIDELLRTEGFHGGLSELRQLLHGDPRALIHPVAHDDPYHLDSPYGPGPHIDELRERPPEGPDAYGAIAEDLLEEPAIAAKSHSDAVVPTAEPSVIP